MADMLEPQTDLSVPKRCQNPPEYGGKLPESAQTSEAGYAPKSFAGLFASTRCVDGLLAMQKVEGSSPFSRFARNPCRLQGFRRSGAGLLRTKHPNPGSQSHRTVERCFYSVSAGSGQSVVLGQRLRGAIRTGPMYPIVKSVVVACRAPVPVANGGEHQVQVEPIEVAQARPGRDSRLGLQLGESAG
ncbi:hypothetical protein [Capillimicrobium parvum]|uniref:hypothetical protein n=1 Tax=Capillimicrobium parvum TaxID=2884022 RepID=UPI00216AE894|nr:hypothetical protein [Capillimicrobium parvum]